jgi:Flp pilus assembly protein TadG
MKAISTMWFRVRRSAANLVGDCRAIAAVEFAVIVPVMMVMFFGTVEFASAVAVSRKVTLVARTLSDLTSQSTVVANSDLTNFFSAAYGILYPYSAPPYPATATKETISELFIDPVTLKARVQWSQGAAPRATSSPVTVPAALAVGGTYLIYSEVSYVYTPAVGYVMGKAGVTLRIPPSPGRASRNVFSIQRHRCRRVARPCDGRARIAVAR